MRHLQQPIFEPDGEHLLRSRDDERVAHGKAARRAVPRSSHAELVLGRPRAPIELLVEQERTRVPELCPVRHARMAVSPFAFYRGAALIMASDLAHTPTSGLDAQICGDAHLANFGMFGTPERDLIFDLNDFDETLSGPWEWDLKRLAASIEIAGRSNGYGKQQRRDSVADTVRCYRQTMVELAQHGNLDVWYARLDTTSVGAELRKLATKRQRKTAGKLVAKAKLQDSTRALGKLTELRDGERHIISQPPLIVPVTELLPRADRESLDRALAQLVSLYAESLPSDRRALIAQYRFVEAARKVVGVGSVGTRCWIVLMIGIDGDDPLFLQVKEADASVLERFLGASPFAQHGQRVVEGQRLMQAASDELLGWVRFAGLDGRERDFYVRQLHDWKGSVPIDSLVPDGMALYGRMCGWTLARAHARSGDRVAIASYLGRSARCDDALVAFAQAYADQNERDYDDFRRAIRSGRLATEAVA
jgi:uncharacterized protein (DUF2252 family)